MPCGPAAPVAPARTPVVLSIPFAGGAWESIGRALAAEYTTRLPGVKADAVMARSLEGQVDEMQAGRADLALEDAETAYLAYSRGTAADAAPHQRLRAIGVLFSIAVQVAVPADSGITRLDQLRGKRVDIGAPGSAVSRASHVIFDSYGFGVDSLAAVPGTSDTLEAFRGHTLDALEVAEASSVPEGRPEDWLARLVEATGSPFASPGGVGQDYRIEGPHLCGNAIVHDGVPLHLQAFDRSN